jgi:hypothetical protein
MRISKFLIFINLSLSVALVVIGGCENPKTSVQADSATRISPSINEQFIGNQLPQKVRDYLKDNFPDASPADTSDYIKSWWSFYERKQVPYFVIADLNDDQAPDYGVIIKRRGTIHLLILLDSADTFKHWMAGDFQEKFNGRDIQFGLVIEPPKRIDVIGEDQSLILRSNGIALMNFENRSRVYYWQQGKMKIFITGDPG